MKNILSVLGALAIIAVIVLGVGGYWAYKKGGSKMVEMSQQMVEDFIKEKKPPLAAENSLRRILNAAKSQKSFVAMMLVGTAMGSMEDNVINEEEIKLMEEGSQLAEQGEISQEKLKTFMEKAEKVMPKKFQYQKKP